MPPELRRRYEDLGKAIDGLPCDVALMLLMVAAGEVIEASGRADELWRGIMRGAHAKLTGAFSVADALASRRTQ